MSSSYIQYYIILFYFIIWEIKWSNGNGPLAGQSDVGLKIIILIGMPESKFHPISPYGCQSGNSKEAFCWWKCSDWCVVFYCSIFFLVLILKNCGLGMQRRCQFFFYSRMKTLCWRKGQHQDPSASGRKWTPKLPCRLSDVSESDMRNKIRSYVVFLLI